MKIQPFTVIIPQSKSILVPIAMIKLASEFKTTQLTTDHDLQSSVHNNRDLATWKHCFAVYIASYCITLNLLTKTIIKYMH